MWALYAGIAVLCFVVMQLLFKQLSVMGLSSPVILVFVYGLGTVLYATHLAITRPPLPMSGRILALLAVAAVLSYAGNLYMVRAVGVAPNPGYAVAVVGLQAVGITLASAFLFGSELTWVKGLGVALSVLGVGLLSL